MTIIRHIDNGADNTRVQNVQPRKRPPTSPEQRAKLSAADALSKTVGVEGSLNFLLMK
jgi:hypothetical protein